MKAATGAASIAAELRAAIGSGTVLRRTAAGVSREALAGGLAFAPLVGLAIGVLAATAAGVVGAVAPSLAGVVGVGVSVALAGPRPPIGFAAAADALLRPGAAAAVLARLRGRPGILGATVAIAGMAARVWAASVLPPAARTTALVFAPLLGAWAVTVQCYGGTPARARGPAAALVGRARFREFGLASLLALGVVLAVADAIGLALVVIAALVTVGLRLYAHRRVGGLTGRLLAATRELVETVVLVTMALLARSAR